MINVRLLLHCIFFFIATALFMPAHIAAQEFTQQQIVNFDWKQFGKQAFEQADYYTKQRITQSTEERAKYIAHEVGRQLNSMRVMPNTNMLTRGMSWKRYGNQAIGTCEHVTDSLKDAMAGGGIDERRLLRVFGEKSAIRSTNPLDVNRNHMALTLVGDSGTVVSYDLWMHGGQRGTFAMFDESIWNSQNIDTWSDIMQKNGYLKQACEDCPDRNLKPPYQMLQTLRDQANLVMRILNAVPRGSVRITVVDSSTGKGLPNSYVVVDGAVNSPVEKIRLSSSTDVSGVITLNGIAQGPYTVSVKNASCSPYKSDLINIKPQSSFNVHLQCKQQALDFYLTLQGAHEAMVNSPVMVTAAISGWSGQSQFKWSLPSGSSCGNAPSCSLLFNRAGTYTVTVSATALVNNSPAATKTASKTIIIRDGVDKNYQQSKPKPPIQQPAAPQKEPGEDQIVAEYRTLLPASLSFDKKPWHTRFDIIANAAKVKPGEYRVNYMTYCIIDKGPNKGKDHKCFEYNAVLNLGQIRSAVADMKKRLRR